MDLRSAQYRHLAFNNQVGNDSEHRYGRKRNAEPAGDSQLECAPLG
jgi:hypothetical protein